MSKSGLQFHETLSMLKSDQMKKLLQEKNSEKFVAYKVAPVDSI